MNAQQNNISSNLEAAIPEVSTLPMSPVKGQLILYTAPEPDEYRYYNGINWQLIIIDNPIKINSDFNYGEVQLILGVALILE